jgi:branched-chain amino acid aminotransferase
VSSRFLFINNQFLPQEEGVLSVTDLSIHRGYAIFDYFRTVHQQPLFLDNYLDRFYASAAHMRLPVPFNRPQLKEVIQLLMQKNNIVHSGIRMTLTGGYSPDGYGLVEPNFILTQQPLQLPSKEAVQKGIKLITYEHQRQLPHVKTTDYLMAIWLQQKVKEKGADDVLYQQGGVVTECPRANFFLITKDDVLVTPAAHILKGITRAKLLALAKQYLKVEERTVTITDFQTAKEAFICSTTKAVLPVVQIDETTINKGVPGPLTLQLYHAFTALEKQYTTAV